jgi:flagellar biosynthetic protein FliQ
MISIFQATTQINEQTLVFIPKIAAVFVAVLIFGPWMLRLMIGYMQELVRNIPMLIG